MPPRPDLITEAELAELRWQKMVAPYARPDLGRSLWGLLTSIPPYLALWALMVWSLSISYGLTLLLAVPAAGFLMRIFIILHDCGHGSYFRSTRANDLVGTLCGFLTFAPYFDWRHEHALHHATAGDLDRRGLGDVNTLTVREFLALPPRGRAWYRLYRNPLFMFGAGGLLLFVVKFRRPYPSAGRRERESVWLTNAALLGIVLLASFTIGLKAYLAIQLPILFLAAAAGNWLFYVQHQFDDTYWRRHPEWDYLPAAMRGSSYYRLPPLLQWFSGNIGFHHIHHLAPRIPNYNLQKCYEHNPAFQRVATLTLLESLKTAGLKLWDEERQALVGWDALPAKASQPGAAD